MSAPKLNPPGHYVRIVGCPDFANGTVIIARSVRYCSVLEAVAYERQGARNVVIEWEASEQTQCVLRTSIVEAVNMWFADTDDQDGWVTGMRFGSSAMPQLSGVRILLEALSRRGLWLTADWDGNTLLLNGPDRHRTKNVRELIRANKEELLRLIEPGKVKAIHGNQRQGYWNARRSGDRAGGIDGQ